MYIYIYIYIYIIYIIESFSAETLQASFFSKCVFSCFWVGYYTKFHVRLRNAQYAVRKWVKITF